MGSTGFRNPRALSSALAALGTLQPRALGFLNPVDPLYTVPNCYVVYQCMLVSNINAKYYNLVDIVGIIHLSPKYSNSEYITCLRNKTHTHAYARTHTHKQTYTHTNAHMHSH